MRNKILFNLALHWQFFGRMHIRLFMTILNHFAINSVIFGNDLIKSAKTVFCRSSNS